MTTGRGPYDTWQRRGIVHALALAPGNLPTIPADRCFVPRGFAGPSR